MIFSSRRHFFSMLELLLVLLIASTALTFVSINVQGMMQEQRFRSEVSSVVSLLRLAQEMMLLLGVDVKIIFTETKKGIEYSLEAEGALNDQWEHIIHKKRALLTGITRIYFEGADGGKKQSSQDMVSLDFLSQGTVMSRGLLIMNGGPDGDGESPTVCLTGYPAPVSAQRLPQARKLCDSDRQQTRALSQQLSGVIKHEVTPPKRK